jgi:signal peptidase I
MFFAKLKNFKKSGKLKKFEKKNKTTLKAKKNKNIKEKLILKKSKNVELTDYDLSLENIESELKKLKNRESRFKFVKVSTYGIIVIVAITIIIVTRIFNVIQISGNSMEPTFSSGNLLISTKIFGYKKQDIIAFYYNNSVLIKRVIATGGDIVYIDDEGNVFVNSEQLEENYVKELAYGNCDITFPFTVPDKELFVLGDNRETSIDSRTKSIGTISENNILGKITVNINHFIFY